MLKNLILTVCLFLCLTRVDAQRRKPAGPPAAPHLEELPQRPLDTLPTDDPETKVILYSNNTWSFYRPSLRTLDSLPVYAQHWDTSQVFAYKSIEYADLPPVIDLKIVKDLSEFTPPVVGNVLSKYGPRRRRNHNGVDIPLKVGEPIRAAFDGRVRYAKYNTGGFGNLVIVRHPNGLETWHAHLSKLNVQVNEYVKTGQVIGFSGNTGRSRGPHLHFEMRYCDQTFDPEFIIDFPLLASAEGDSTTTSTDILARIAEAQNKEKAESQRSTLSQSTAVYHTIRSGDMLGKLAIKYGVSIDQICRLNKISRTTILQLGRKLRIK